MTASVRFVLALLVLALAGTLLVMGMSPPPAVEPQSSTMTRDSLQASRSDIWSGGAATLLGAIIGFAAAWLPKYWDDRRKRQALATGLLSEIRFLDARLREIYAISDPSMHVIAFLETAIYDQATTDLLLFSPKTMHDLNGFYYMVHAFRAALTAIRNGDLRPSTQFGYIRLFSSTIISYIPNLTRQLRDAGGRWPEVAPPLDVQSSLEEEALAYEPPSLPSSVFKRSEPKP